MFFNTAISAFMGYTGSTWEAMPVTTASSISYTPANGLTSNNVQAALSELALSKVGFTGNRLLDGRLVMGSFDPLTYGRLGTSNAVGAGVFALTTSTVPVAAVMWSDSTTTRFGSMTNHPVQLMVNSQTVLQLNIDGTATWTAKPIFNTPVNANLGAADAGRSALEIIAPNAAPAVVAFNRNNTHAVYFGLDTDNQLKVGGWSLGAVKHTIVHSGNVASYLPTNQVYGQGQEYFDLTSSRAKNTLYTNPTGQTIHVNVLVKATSGIQIAEMQVAGKRAALATPNTVGAPPPFIGVTGPDYSSTANLSVMVGPNESYRLNFAGTVVSWTERRPV